MPQLDIFVSGFDDPGVFIDTRPSPRQSGQGDLPQIALIIGQRLATGTKPASELFQLFSDEEAVGYAGRGSMFERMVKAFRSVNRVTELWGITADDDGAAVAAEKEVTITGPATAAGAFAAYIEGIKYAVAVAVGDTPTDIAALWAAEVNSVNRQELAPFIATAALGVVTLVARNEGEAGSHIDVRFNYRQGDVFPAGVAATVAESVAGATNPDITAIIAALGDRWFTSIVMPYTDAANTAILGTELDRRFGPDKMLDGQAFAWQPPGTVSEQVILANTFDHKNIHLMMYGREPESPWVKAARLAGEEANRGDPVNVRDKTVLSGMLPPQVGAELNDDERRSIRAARSATFTTDARGTCRIEILYTTYKTNDQALPDVKNFQDVESLRRLAGIRYLLRLRLATVFAQVNIADSVEDVAPGVPVVDVETIRAEIVGEAISFVRRGWVENIDQFKDDLTIERDPGNVNRVCGRISPDLVNVLRQIGLANEFIT
jgi:phage tail sheath gpL-like